MNFTYFEFFLIVFSSAFIIFSLAIRTESNKKYFDFMTYLESLKNYIDKIIKEKKIELSKDKIIGLKETIEARGKLFKTCLSQVNTYIYHSFYAVFFLSVLGMGISSISELNLFNIYPTFEEELVHLLAVIHIIALLLLYWYTRAAFVLVLYTKIDYEYLEKLARKIDEIIGLKKLLTLDDEQKNELANFKINGLRYFLFPLFLVSNKEFKEFFYKYYNL